MRSAIKRTVIALLLLAVAWAVACNAETLSMIREQREITVQKPRQEVFDFLNDETKLSSWVNGITSIEPFGEPKQGVGAKAKLVVSVPTEAEFVSVVSEWDPPKRFAWSVDMKEMASTQTYTLEDLGDGATKVVLEVEHRPKTFMMKLLSPLIGWSIKKERAKEMVRLKTMLEESSAVESGV